MVKSVINFFQFVFVLFVFHTHLYSLTIGVLDFQTGGTGLDTGKLVAYFQAEMSGNKKYKVIEDDARNKILENLKQCQMGLIGCSNETVNLKSLDIAIFAKIVKLQHGFLLSIRGINTGNGSVVFSVSYQGENIESLLSLVSDQFQKNLDTIANLYQQSKEQPYRIAIYPTKEAGEKASQLKIQGIMDTILITAFGENQKFQVIENIRPESVSNQKLLKEKTLSIMGLSEEPLANTGFTGVTHYLSSTLIVKENLRILTYQLVHSSTGKPVVNGKVEWTDEKEMIEAIKKLATDCESSFFNGNGKLSIKDCGLTGVEVYIKTEKYLDKIGYCPFKLEDILKGNYTLVFQHEEKDTLEKQISIEANKETIIEKVELPPVDLTSFENGIKLEKKGKYEEAISEFKNFYERYPRYKKSTYCMYREGFILQMRLNHIAEGRKILEDVIGRKPDLDYRTEAFIGIHLGYQKEGNNARSKEILEMLIKEYKGTSASDYASTCLKENRCDL